MEISRKVILRIFMIMCHSSFDETKNHSLQERGEKEREKERKRAKKKRFSRRMTKKEIPNHFFKSVFSIERKKKERKRERVRKKRKNFD